jgi:hypothetical protein
MYENPSSSFFRFLLGFLTFISLSFVVTYAVGSYTIAQEEHEQTAAVFETLVGENSAPAGL